MTEQDIKATLIISLLAAYADSGKHDRERDEIRRIAEGLAGPAEINLATLHQDVLFKRTSLEAAARQLQSEEARQLAYEMAVCVCDADGGTSDRELDFLRDLRRVLGLDSGFVQQTLDESAAVADAPLSAPPAASAPPSLTPSRAPHVDPLSGSAGSAGTDSIGGAEQTHASGSGAPARAANGPQPSTMSREEIDNRILRASITNGAIELLPESLSTMAIIPLQMQLVYQIGESYGYTLDKGHIRDFLATVGLGMTSQYLEQAGRKLLNGLLGKKRSKGLFGKVGKQAVSSGMSFAATYALGHVANQYYAGGRTLSTQMLKNTYNHILGLGQQLQQQYLPQMQTEARSLDVARIVSMVRGGNG
ncbi:MAG: TerB family tellurite resistance protein [Lautropia sp.]|nr:TerB family tellurite resistance protein [Lautropia sp.]